MTSEKEHPLRCDTCSKKGKIVCPIQDEIARADIGSRRNKWNWWIPSGAEVVRSVTEIIGCASHPRSTAPSPELIGAVIRELEAFDEKCAGRCIGHIRKDAILTMNVFDDELSKLKTTIALMQECPKDEAPKKESGPWYPTDLYRQRENP